VQVETICVDRWGVVYNREDGADLTLERQAEEQQRMEMERSGGEGRVVGGMLDGMRLVMDESGILQKVAIVKPQRPARDGSSSAAAIAAPHLINHEESSYCADASATLKASTRVEQGELEASAASKSEAGEGTARSFASDSTVECVGRKVHSAGPPHSVFYKAATPRNGRLRVQRTTEANEFVAHTRVPTD